MIIELVNDFVELLATMPAKHPRYQILELLDEAVRRDTHFIGRHPTALFQCLWNSGWWYDCPEAQQYYQSNAVHSMNADGNKLCNLLQYWRLLKERETPGFRWLRTIRPPKQTLGSNFWAQCPRLGPDYVLYDLTYISDAGLLVTVGNDGALRTWDAATGQQITKTQFSNGTITSVDISNDGKLLAFAAEGHISVIDRFSGALLFEARFKTKRTWCIRFSPDGGRVAFGQDCLVRVWNVSESKEVCCLHGLTDMVGIVTWSPDGQVIAAGARGMLEKTVILWDATSGAPLTIISGQEKSTPAVAFSPDGRWLATGSDDGVARLFDASTGRWLLSIPGHTNGVASIVFSHQSDLLITGEGRTNLSADNFIRVWSLPTGQLLSSWIAHRGAVNALSIIEDGRKLASVSHDGTAKIWSLARTAPTRELISRVPGVSEFALSPDGRWIATNSRNETSSWVTIWSFDTGLEVRRIELDCFPNRLAFSSDGDRLAIAGKTLQLWDVIVGRKVSELTDEDDYWNVAFAPDRHHIAARGSRSITIWDVTSSSFNYRLSPSADFSRVMRYSPTGDLLAAVFGSQLRVWEVRSGKLLYEYEGPSNCAFSNDGKLLAICGCDLVGVLDALTGRTLMLSEMCSATQIRFSHDGHEFITMGRNGARRWNLETGESAYAGEGFADLDHGMDLGADCRWWCVSDSTELTILNRESNKAAGWYAQPLLSVSGHPMGQRWLGFRMLDDYLAILKFEGGDGID